MQLFKIVTTKDEISVGLDASELSTLGQGAPIDVIAAALFSRGFLTMWQYASARGQDGTVKQAPLRRVTIGARAVVRIEPLSTDQEVVPPKA